MTYEFWKQEPLLREVEINKRIDIITGIISRYLAYRNISNSPEQQAIISNAINIELIRMPYLKKITVRWALHKFTDMANSNISAALIIDYLRKGYNHELHKEILKQWHKDEVDNRIPEITDSAKEEKNKEARKLAFDLATESVKNNLVNLDDWFWKNTYLYLAKDLEFRPDQEILDRFEKMAIEMIEKEIKAELANPDLNRDKRSKSTKHLSELLTLEKDPELKSRIDLLRKKLITMDFITREYSKQIEKQLR